MARRAFGEYEVDPATGEVWRDGTSFRLQDQPLKLLICLLDHPGELVDHEELRHRVWKDDIHVDFEDGLHAAAWRLRQALGDSAEHPRYIETVPRKGYRLVCPVAPVRASPGGPMEAAPVSSEARGPEALPAPAGPVRRRRWRWILLPLFGLLGAGTILGLRSEPRLRVVPLLNGTGDPALDYLASALDREVQAELRASYGIRCHSSGTTDPDELRVEWGLEREGTGYRVKVALKSSAGARIAEEIFRCEPGGLNRWHGRLAAFIATEVREERERQG